LSSSSISLSPVTLESPIAVTSNFFVSSLEDEKSDNLSKKDGHKTKDTNLSGKKDLLVKENLLNLDNLPIFNLKDDELMGLGTCKMSLDSTYTYLHASRVLLDIVDDQWASDKLPDEDIVVKVVDPVPYLNISDDEDEKELQPNETWTDLGLDQFKI